MKRRAILPALATLAAMSGCVSLAPPATGAKAPPAPAVQAPAIPPVVAKPSVRAPKDRWGEASLPTRKDLRAVSAPAPLVAIAVGQAGTVVKTTDGGATWALATPPGTPPDDLQDAAFLDALTGWALGTKALYATEDGGATWTTHDLFGTIDPYGRPEGGEVVRRDDLRGAFVARGNVWSTVDGGKTWKHLLAPQAVAGSIQHALQVEAGLVAMGDGYALWNGQGLFRVPEGDAPAERGEPVEGFTTVAGGANFAALDLVFRTPTDGWAIGLGGSGAMQRRTTDGGRTWSSAPIASTHAPGAHPSLTFFDKTADLQVIDDRRAVAIGTSRAGALMAETTDGAGWVISSGFGYGVLDLALPDATHGYAVGLGGTAWTITSN